jgi:segregation and condensation protein B
MTESVADESDSTPRFGLTDRITALLFVADDPLDLATLARVLRATLAEIEQAVATLAAQPPAGLIIQRHGELIQLATQPALAADVRRLRGDGEPQRLSRAALEVLSVIAYRQPCTRADIEAVRGVNSDHALETLLARALVQELGRRETVGRPMAFGTTLEFLQLAGFGSLDDLPPLDAASERQINALERGES